MEFGKIVRWIALAGVLFAIWKFGLPWVQGKVGQSDSEEVESVQAACATAAAAASEQWGGGLARFVNPPYDMDAWSTFRSEVESKIASAEKTCRCSEDPCTTARSAMSELRSLVSDLDSSISNGTSPPDDIVRRQEAIDDAISEAQALAR